MQLVVVTTVGSTNQVLAEAARAGAPDGLVLQAREQVEGRGQRGQGWLSPPGGLWMSVLVRARIPAKRAGWLPLVTGAVVARQLRELDIDARIKWPNDIMIGSAKLGGVLAESSLLGPALDWSVLGVGINVENDPPLGTATSLNELGLAVSPDDLAPPIASAIIDAAHLLASGDHLPARKAYLEHDATLDRPVIAGDVRGVAVAIGEHGELLVETEGGTIALRGGPLTFADAMS